MIYEYWYAGISGLNCMKKKKLREILKTAEMIYYIEEIKLTELGILTDREIQALIKAKKQQDIKEKWEMLEEKNIRFIPYFSEEYPVRLKNIPAPPYALYVRGRLPDSDRPAAALVGARNCTHYGERMALEYGEKLAENGISIISGMARGIDGAGQRGALNAGGNDIWYIRMWRGYLLSGRTSRTISGSDQKRRCDFRTESGKPASCQVLSCA